MASDGTTAARLLVDVQGRGINETAGGLGRMDSAVRGTSMGIGGLVRAAGGIYAVKKAFDFTIGAAIEWESAFAGVEKTVDASDAELAGLESTLLGMSRTMPIAAGELAGIAEAAGALGIAVPDIEEFTKTVAMIGETTNISSDQAATALGKLSNVIGLTVDDYDNFGAALVDLGNKGASTESEILGIAERFGAAGALAGASADQILGWSAAVANLGIEAEAGGSAMQRFVIDSISHVAAAGDELKTLAETAGMSTAAFSKAFGEDSLGALQVFIAGLGELTQAQQLAVLESLGWNDVRITRSILGLSGDVDNLNDSVDNAATGMKEGTALTTEYGKRAETAASKIEILGNRLADLGRRAGGSQEGILSWFLEDADKALGEAEHLADNIGDVAFTIGSSFGDMALQMDEVADSIGMNRTAFKVLANEIHAQYGGTVQEVLDQAVDSIRGIAPAMSDATRGALAAWKQADLGGAIVEDIEKVDDLFSRGGLGIAQPITEEMAEAREAAVEGMAGVMDALNNSLRDGKDEYTASWEDFLDGQKDPFTTAQRNAFIAGQFTGSEFDDGLHSEDPEHVANTVEYVNAQLAEFELLNPGALAIGEGVPANLQAGMEAIAPELDAYVKALTGDTLENLSLEEAGKYGLDGIWYWFQGMKDAEAANALVAGAIATRAVNQLNLSKPAYSGGYATGASFMNGITAAFWAKNPEVVTALNYMRRQLGGSLPEIGPLAGGAGPGGESIASSWINAIVGTLDAGMGGVAGAIGGVGSLFEGNYAAGVGGGAAVASTGSGEVHYHKHIEVNVESRPLDGSAEELVRVLQAADSVSDWGMVDG